MSPNDVSFVYLDPQYTNSVLCFTSFVMVSDLVHHPIGLLENPPPFFGLTNMGWTIGFIPCLFLSNIPSVITCLFTIKKNCWLLF